MDILSRLLKVNIEVKGIKIRKDTPAIHHLMYADDMLLVGRASIKNARAMWGYLENFCQWSGQRVNRDKSNILFFNNTCRTVKTRVKELWGLRSMQGNSIYLGNSLILSKNQTKEFAKLRERVQRRLEGWQSQLLSKAEKATLIRSVVQAMPIYSMATFRIPKGVCESLDAIVRRFWWGAKPGSSRYMALKSWDSICTPKLAGGLGFRKFK